MGNDTFDPVRIGVVSVSDRASAGTYEDKGIPALKEWLGRAVRNPITWEARLIPDEHDAIAEVGELLTQLFQETHFQLRIRGHTYRLANRRWSRRKVSKVTVSLRLLDNSVNTDWLSVNNGTGKDVFLVQKSYS